MSKDSDTYLTKGAFGVYGLVATNPIPVAGPKGELEYASRLTCPCNVPFAFHRLQISGLAPDGHVLDAYEFLCFNKSHRYTLYFDMYHKPGRFKAPRGLVLADRAQGVGSHLTIDNFDRQSLDEIKPQSGQEAADGHYEDLRSALRLSKLPVFVYTLLWLAVLVLIVVRRHGVYEIVGWPRGTALLMPVWLLAIVVVSSACHHATSYWYRRMRGQPYRSDMTNFAKALGFDIAHGAGLLTFLIQFEAYWLLLPHYSGAVRLLYNPWSFILLYLLWSQLFVCIITHIKFRRKSEWR